MRLTFKHLIVLWGLLLVLVGSLLINAYSKLRPEMFIGVLTEYVQKNYPGTQLSVRSIDYRVSVDFNLVLKNVTLKRSEVVLANLEEIEVRLPWWLLLFEKGNAQINLSKLVIFVDDKAADFKVSSSPSEKQLPSSKNFGIKLTIPDYLDGAQFTLRAKDVTVQDLESSRRYFTMSKLLVREFQFGKNSAFELILPISITHNDVTFDSELWLFGDLTPNRDEWNFHYRGEFRTSDAREKVQLEDIVIDGNAKLKPDILSVNSAFTFYIEKLQSGLGTFRADQNEVDLNLKLSNFPLNFLTLFKDEIKTSYLPDLTEKASGMFELNKKYKNDTVKLGGSLDFPGAFKLGNSETVDGKWRFVFNGSKWETSFITPKGDVSFFRRSVIDFKKGIIVQYVEELGFTEINLDGPIQLIKPLNVFLAESIGTYSASTVSFKKCSHGDKIIDGLFRYGASPDQRFYMAELKDQTGEIKLNFVNVALTNKLDLSANTFQWNDSYKFLEPFFNTESGKLDGKIQGRWKENWSDGQWSSKFRVDSLVNVAGKFIWLINKFWNVFEIDSLVAPSQSGSFTIQNKRLSLNPLALETQDALKMTGQVDLNLNGTSVLTLNKKRAKPIKRELKDAFWNEK